MKSASVIATLIFFVSLLTIASGCTNRAAHSSLPRQTTKMVAAESPSFEILVKDGFVYASIPRISAEELKRLLDSGDEIILVDNRSEYKFKMGHLAGAINITYAVDSPYPGTEEEMDSELSTLPNDTLKILYCD